ncbi:MAG: phage tail tape measure protein [Ruminococcus sp.]|nr:phage tail tape measure protein [Ruminococcus sp.]
MAKQTEITTKFSADISSLKAGIKDANRQIKLANAEFKAASSAMDFMADSADGIKKKIDQLSKVYEAQNKILDSYKEQLKQVEKEQGENSAGAENLKIKIANQQAAVNKTATELKTYTEKLEDVEKAQSDSADAADKQGTAFDDLKEKIKSQESTLADLKEQYASVVLEQGKESDQAKELAGEIDNLSSELSEDKKAMKEAEDAADDLDKSLEEVEDSADDASEGFTVMKGALAELVADGLRLAISAMKDFVAESVKIGMNFDSAMSQVQAVSGATGEELQALRDKAKEMGATTKFTATEAADAFNYMAMAGWKTEDMLSGIDGILSLAAASGTDLATTSDIVTDALTAMGYSAKDAGRLADVMAAASSNANTNVEMMGQTFQYAAPVAGAMGYSMEDTAVAIGLMANAGIKADKAGTSLRSILTRLAAPTKESGTAMDKLGLTITNADGSMKSFDKIIKELRTSMGKLGEAEQAEIAKQLAGQNAMSGLLAIVNAAPEDYEKLKNAVANASFSIDEVNATLEQSGIDWEKYSDKAWMAGSGIEGLTQEIVHNVQEVGGSTEELQEYLSSEYDLSMEDAAKAIESVTGAMDDATGAASKMADTMMDNLGGDMTKLSSQFEGVKLQLYEKLTPALRAGTKVLSKLIDKLGWFIDHGDKVVAVIAGIGAAFVAWKAASLVKSIVALVTAIKAMGAAAAFTAAKQWLLNTALFANPIGLIVAAIAGLVAAFAVLWNTSEDFRNFFLGMWEAIKETIGEYLDAIVNFFKAAWEGIQLAWAGVKEFFSGIWDAIKNVFTAAATWFKDKFEAAWNAIKEAWANVKSFFTGIWNGIKEAFSNVKTWFSDIFSGAWEAIKGVWNGVKDFFSGIWEDIKDVFSGVESWFKKIFQGAKDAVSTIFEGLVEIIKAPINLIIDGINAFIRGLNKIKIPDWVPGVGGKGLSFDEIPKLAKGGVLARGQVGLLEGSGAEAVVPLERNRAWIAAVAQDLKSALAAEGLGGMMGGRPEINYNYNFVQNNNSPKALDRLEIYRQTKNQLELAKGV